MKTPILTIIKKIEPFLRVKKHMGPPLNRFEGWKAISAFVRPKVSHPYERREGCPSPKIEGLVV